MSTNRDDLTKRARVVMLALLNGTGKPEDAPYLADTPEKMEQRLRDMREAGVDRDDFDADVALNIADDCRFCVVKNIEGQPAWDAAYAIAGAGVVIHDLLAALPRWTPCDEAVPLARGLYLCHLRNGDQMITYYAADEVRHVSFWKNHVTHWQLMQEGPVPT